MTARHDIETEVIGVLLCYDLPIAGLYAKEVLNRVIAQSGHEAICDVRLWRNDLLDLPEVQWQAAMEAESSPLFAAAFTSGGKPPEGFLRLAEQWAKAHASSEAMVVVLQVGTTDNSAWVRSLHRIAEQHRVGFLYSGGDALSATGLNSLARPPDHRSLLPARKLEWNPLSGGVLRD